MPQLGNLNQIKILGKKYNNNNITKLRKDLDIKADTIKEANDITRAVRSNVSKEKVIYNTVTGNLEKISLKDKPLIIREFLDINRVGKNLRTDIITKEEFGTKNRKGEDILIYPKNIPFTNNDTLSILVVFRVWIDYSDDIWGDRSSIRTLTFNYYGKAGDIPKKQMYIYRRTKREHIKEIKNSKFEFDSSDDRSSFEDKFDKSSREKKNFNYEQHPFFKQLIDHYYERDYTFPFFLFEYNIVTPKGSEYDITQMKLRGVKYDNIKINIFNEAIDIDNSNENCVIRYLNIKYPKLKKEIEEHFQTTDEFYDYDGITTDDIIHFCEKYDIKCFAYDTERNLIGINKTKCKKMRPLIFVAYNNHIYPLKNKLLKKDVEIYQDYEYMDSDKIKNKFTEIISKRIIPKDVKISVSKKDNVYVSGFIHKDVVYHNNTDLIDCKRILSIFGCDDKVTHNINRYNIIDTLSELYNIPDYSSFMPLLNHYTNPAFVYHKNISDDEVENILDTIITKDKNKAYGYSIFDLDYLYIVDIKYDNIIENPTGETNINYVYIIDPEFSTILIPKCGYYTGEELEYFDREGISYKKLYEIQAKRVNNKYKDLIKDYYEKTMELVRSDLLDDPNIIKQIINIFLGKFERGQHLNTKIEFKKICNEDEASKSGYKYIDIGNGYYICYDEIKNYDIKSMKLISIQIKNRCRRIVYEELKRLNIKDDDVIQINTDSISYIKTDTNINDNKNINEKDFRMWKIQPYKKAKDNIFEVINESIDMKEILRLNQNRNQLCLGYAGCGKTQSIIKTLLPQLNKDQNQKKSLYENVSSNEKTYIILTPSHASLQFYRKINEPCDVIQKYSYNSKLDNKYTTIIVDEIGMCGKKAFNFLYKCSRQGIRIFAYGDFKQLPPIDKEGSSRDIQEYFLKLLFSKIIKTDKNYRNNFTTKYYDSLINDKVNLIDEINKHSEDDYKCAEVIICFRNDTVDLYNEKVLKDKDIDKETPGCKVICKTNKVREYNIYNNYIMEVVEVNEEKEIIILQDEIDTYKIPLSIYRKKMGKNYYFKPAYARTIYSLQGSTIKNYYIAPEDIKFFNDPNTAYTIISRKSN